jgi:hypothetical protein
MDDGRTTTRACAVHNTSRYYFGYDLDYTADAYAFVMFGVTWLMTIVAEQLARATRPAGGLGVRQTLIELSETYTIEKQERLE